MKITKIGHCCMLIEERGVRLLTDPGAFTAEKHIALTAIDAILFTHEHADHFHLESLRTILKNNPKARVICNPSVADLLGNASISHEIVGDDHSVDVKGVQINGHGSKHAEIHSSFPAMQNTGYFIAGRLWYPGDALDVDPGVKIDIMALPVAGPWMKLSEALDYALRLKPSGVFPVHDMILNTALTGFIPQTVAAILEPRGVRLYSVELDQEYEF